MNFLSKIRSQPRPVKSLIMWSGVFFVMLLIFGFWILTFNSEIRESRETETALKKELPGIWQSLKAQINEIKNLWRK